MSAKYVWLDGELVEWPKATVHVAGFGLQYGIGFFEGIRCYETPDGPSLFRIHDHLRRLRRSAAIYSLSLPYEDAVLADACKQIVLENDFRQCYVRPMAFVGEGSNPLLAPFHVTIIATQDGPLVGPVKEDGVNACISSFQRFAANAMPPAAKATGQYLNSYLSQLEAIRSGNDEAILLNAGGQIADGWAHNVFVVSNNSVLTPPTSAGALSGITRDSIMVLGAENGISVGEKELVRSDLYLADECFLTGTAAGVLPVVSVDGRRVGSGATGPVTNVLRSLLDSVATGKVEDHPEWRCYVS